MAGGKHTDTRPVRDTAAGVTAQGPAHETHWYIDILSNSNRLQEKAHRQRCKWADRLASDEGSDKQVEGGTSSC